MPRSVVCTLPSRGGLTSSTRRQLNQLQTGATVVIATVDEDRPNNRLNDAKCDPVCCNLRGFSAHSQQQGRIWAGTMGPEPKPAQVEPNAGSLVFGLLLHFQCAHRFSTAWTPMAMSPSTWRASPSRTALRGQKTPSSSCLMHARALISRRTMYFIDSLAFAVYAMDFDTEAGTISNRRVAIDYKTEPALAACALCVATSRHLLQVPDGMCIDEDDKIWVASFFGSRVHSFRVRVSPHSPRSHGGIQQPARSSRPSCFLPTGFTLCVPCCACSSVPASRRARLRARTMTSCG